jgi:endonuclease IV
LVVRVLVNVMVKYYYKINILDFTTHIDKIPSEYVEFYFIPGQDKLFDNNDYVLKCREIISDLVVHAPYEKYGCYPGSDDPVVREYTLNIYKSCVDLLYKLGFSKLIVHPGKVNHEDELEECIKRSADLFNDIALYAKERGVDIFVENLIYGVLSKELYCVCNVDTMSKLFSYLKEDNIFIVFDFAHAVATSHNFKLDYKIFIDEFCNIFYDKIKHFHLSDGDVSCDHDGHLNILDGNYDIKFMVDVMKRFCEPRCTLEIPFSFEFKLDDVLLK